MNYWLTTQAKPKIAAKAVLLIFAVITAIMTMAMPVLADTKDVPNNIVVYDNREKTLKITEISFTNDFTSMSVLVENIQTKDNFRIEHELDTGDTINEYIEITATDGMGNISETVNIKNPFYLPEIVEPTPEPSKGSLSVTGGSGNGSENETVSKNNEVDPVKSGFNTNGWATVVDNADTSNKEFFIIRSETGNEFYVIIDRENGKDNVYFLNAVTEWDLLGLTQKYEVPNNLNPNSDLNGIVDKGSTADNTKSGETKENSENQEGQPSAEPSEKTPTSAEPQQQGGIGVFGIIMLILFVGAVGAYFYFFKFKRKSHNTNDDDFLPDDYGEDDDDEDDNEDDAEVEEEEYDEDNEAESLEPPKSSSTPVSNPPEKIDKDIGVVDDKEVFTEDDEVFEFDDFDRDIDEKDVMRGLGGDEDEDNTV